MLTITLLQVNNLHFELVMSDPFNASPSIGQRNTVFDLIAQLVF